MALPETDLNRILLWARQRVPEHLWGQVKVEADFSERHVDIVEVRPPWDGVGEHTRFPVARLRYMKSTGLWAIYWRDRNLKFDSTGASARPRMSRRFSITSRPTATLSPGVSERLIDCRYSGE